MQASDSTWSANWQKTFFRPRTPPPVALTVLDRAMVLPPTLIERIVQFLFQVNMTILVFSALMLSPLVSHHFSIVLIVFLRTLPNDPCITSFG